MKSPNQIIIQKSPLVDQSYICICIDIKPHSGIESAGEAIHANLHQSYKDFIVIDSNSPAYYEKLFKAVKLYNVLHV